MRNIGDPKITSLRINARPKRLMIRPDSKPPSAPPKAAPVLKIPKVMTEVWRSSCAKRIKTEKPSALIPLIEPKINASGRKKGWCQSQLKPSLSSALKSGLTSEMACRLIIEDAINPMSPAEAKKLVPSNASGAKTEILKRSDASGGPTKFCIRDSEVHMRPLAVSS